MVFRGSKKVLFDNAYTSYREIIKETENIYSGLKENFELGHEKFRQLPIIALSVDIYLQVKFSSLTPDYFLLLSERTIG